jgi:hypothetical protein
VSELARSLSIRLSETQLTGEFKERLAQINSRIASACLRAHRQPGEVTLMAVSKTVAPEMIQSAIESGIHALGENRVQEAATKIPVLSALSTRHSVQWHLIGHLQSNKVRRAIELFDAIHSLDSYDLAVRLDRIAGEVNKKIPVFIQVNTGNEESKSGITPQEALSLCEKAAKLTHLDLRGLMTVPPYFAEAENARPFFRQLRELRDAARKAGIVADLFTELSMGMSHDFEIAIAEGATFIRVGTALFGERNYPQT